MTAHHDLPADALLSHHNSGPLLPRKVPDMLACTDAHTDEDRPYMHQLQRGLALLASHKQRQGRSLQCERGWDGGSSGGGGGGGGALEWGLGWGGLEGRTLHSA